MTCRLQVVFSDKLVAGYDELKSSTFVSKEKDRRKQKLLMSKPPRFTFADYSSSLNMLEHHYNAHEISRLRKADSPW